MKKLAPLFAVTVLALPGIGLANADDTASQASPPAANAQSDNDSKSQAPGEVTEPKGFLLIQRNIYVPVDADGKATSDHAIVIDRQGFITAEELAAAQRESGDGDNGGMKGDDNAPGAGKESPKAQDSAPALPRSEPSVNGHVPLGRGPVHAT